MDRNADKILEDLKKSRVNRVAFGMQAMMGAVEKMVTSVAETDQHNVILIIGVGDVVQYASNCKREDMKQVLTDLFERWQLALPEVKGQDRQALIQSENLHQFNYLMNKFVASLSDDPLNIKHNREELSIYVAGILRDLNAARDDGR